MNQRNTIAGEARHRGRPATRSRRARGTRWSDELYRRDDRYDEQMEWMAEDHLYVHVADDGGADVDATARRIGDGLTALDFSVMNERERAAAILRSVSGGG